MRRLSGLACPAFSCSDQSAAKASAAATAGRSADDQSAAMACVDDMISRLLRCKPGGKGKELNAGLTESELILLCRESREDFLRYPMLLSVLATSVLPSLLVSEVCPLDCTSSYVPLLSLV